MLAEGAISQVLIGFVSILLVGVVEFGSINESPTGPMLLLHVNSASTDRIYQVGVQVKFRQCGVTVVLRGFDYALVMLRLVYLKGLDFYGIILWLDSHRTNAFIRLWESVLSNWGQVIMKKRLLQHLRSCASFLR